MVLGMQLMGATLLVASCLLLAFLYHSYSEKRVRALATPPLPLQQPQELQQLQEEEALQQETHNPLNPLGQRRGQGPPSWRR